MAESIPPSSENILNESDSEFLSALDQAFATAISMDKVLETLNTTANKKQSTATTETINKSLSQANIATEPQKNSKTKTPPIEIIPKDNTYDPPRIETFLHTSDVKPTTETLTVEVKSTTAELSELKIQSTPIITNATPIQNTSQNTNNIIEKRRTITLWLAAMSLIIAGIAIWQINELYEYLFRLETMNKTLEAKLLETLNRIDLIKNNFVRIEKMIQKLEPPPTSISTIITEP
jgi:hypothetical protein